MFHPVRSVLRFLPLLLVVVLLLLYAWRQIQGPVVAVHVAELRPLVQHVVASGEVRSDSLVRIGSEITGVVRERGVREGDRVAAGDLLLQLEDAEQQARVLEAAAALELLATTRRPQAAAALREAEQAVVQANGELARREALALQSQVAEEQLELARSAAVAARVARDTAELQLKSLAAGAAEERQAQQRLEAAKAALARTRLTAPVAGVVQRRLVEPGDLVQPGALLLELAREQSLKIVVPVDEKNIGGVAVGQPASIIADAYPMQVVAGKVSFMAPAVDVARGTLDVDVDLLEPAALLRQGMTVSVSIETGRRDSALVLPNDLLLASEGNMAQVQVVRDGRVEQLAVTLGLRGSVASEVVTGLQPGAQVLLQPREHGQRVRVQRGAASVSNGE